MKIWPVNTFDVHTSFSPEKVLDIVQANTEPKKLFRINREHRYFEGECSQETFTINRIIHYRNSFSPRVTGFVMPERSGSIVKIKMKLHPLTIAFMSLWFTGVILAVPGASVAFIAKPAEATMIMLVPLGMLVFGVTLISGAFWFEATKQQEKLIALLKS